MQNRYMILRFRLSEFDDIGSFDVEQIQHTVGGNTQHIKLPCEESRVLVCNTEAERSAAISALVSEFPGDVFIKCDVIGMNIPERPTYKTWQINADGVMLPCV